MKKLVSLLAVTLVVGALATVPAMAQGTTKQQPTKKPVATKTTAKAHKTVADTMNKGQTGAKHESMAADTSKKGRMAAKHTRRHHKKVVKKTSSKKPAEKKVGPEK